MHKGTQKGFTIIEVVLVLAIASLIFLMAITALPALQSGQRDTARKNDLAAVQSAITNYSSNNNGKLPPEGTYQIPGTTGFSTYLSSVGSNTTSVVVKPQVGTNGTSVQATEGEIDVYLSSVCSDVDQTVGKYVLNKGSTRQYAVVTKLEAGGGVAFCQ